MRLSFVPLVLMLTATVWFAVRPGFGTFFVAFLAFGLWFWARLAEWIWGKTLKLRQRIDEHLGLTPPPPVSPEKLPSDPEFRKLIEDLRGALDEPELREEARKAMAQLTRLPDLFAKFESLLKEKLSEGELTHERYLASGQRVYQSTLSELRDATRRMVELEVIRRDTHGPSAQMALRQLRREQKQRISALLERSEEALTEMARINIAVAAMRDKSSSSSPEFEEAIRDLRELAERTTRY